jgi:hypothetical protein
VGVLRPEEEDFIPLDLDAIGLDWRRSWAGDDSAGRDVELAAVTGAGDDVAAEGSIGKQAAAVTAHVIEGKEPAADVCHRD